MRDFQSMVLLLCLALTLAGCSTELSVPGSDEPVFVAEGEDLDAQMVAIADGWLKTPLLSTGREFNRIAMRFDATQKVDLQARTVDKNGAVLQDWKNMEYFFSEDIAHSVVLDFDKKFEYAEVRYKSDAGVKVEFLVADLIEIGESAELEETEIGSDAELELSDSNTVEEGLTASYIVSRKKWRARRRKCAKWHKPKRITIHHTVSPVRDRLSVPARVRQIQKYHQRTRGYCDVSYHFLIGRDGKVYQGRYEKRIGAHTRGANTGNIGIAFIGNFVKKRPSTKMLNVAGKLMRQLSKKYKIRLNTSVVKEHRNRGTTRTVCPGWSFHKVFKKWLRLVAKGKNYSGSSANASNSSSGSTLSAGDGSCYSATVGARVENQSYVQVNRRDCGKDRCGWFQCHNGSFACSTHRPWINEKGYPHAQCQ